MKKTLGQMIDELIVTNLKIWQCENIKHSSNSDQKIADACRKTNILNPQRNSLIESIDERINELIKNQETQELFSQGKTKIYG